MGCTRQLAAKSLVLLIYINHLIIRFLVNVQIGFNKILGNLQGEIVPSATTKSIQVQYERLDTPSDMGKALKFGLNIGYRGTLEAYKDNMGIEVWGIELSGPGNPGNPVLASLGDVLIWDNVRLDAMSSDTFLTKYTPAA